MSQKVEKGSVDIPSFRQDYCNGRYLLRMKAHLNTIGQAQEAGRWTASAGVFRDVTCVQLLNYICLLDDSLRDVLRDMSKAELINIALTAEPALSQEQVLKTLNAANQSWLDNLLEKSE